MILQHKQSHLAVMVSAIMAQAKYNTHTEMTADTSTVERREKIRSADGDQAKE